MGNQEGADRHGDAADHAQHKHTEREDGEIAAGHQPDYRQHHQDEAENQLALQWHNHHQPGVQENRRQDAAVEEGEGITHAGDGDLKIFCDIAHYHAGNDHQRAGQRVGEEAYPGKANTITVCHVLNLLRTGCQKVSESVNGTVILINKQ